MYSKLIVVGEWEKAHSLATRHLESEQVTRLFLKQGQALEAVGKLRDAEKLYVTVDQPDMAIAMYKAQRQYDQVCHFPKMVTTKLTL